MTGYSRSHLYEEKEEEEEEEEEESESLLGSPDPVSSFAFVSVSRATPLAR